MAGGRIMRWRIARAGLACLALAAGSAGVAQPVDPDWPCVQRKVPSLSIGQMWSGPMPEGDWREDPAVRELAPALAARRNPLEAVEARIDAFAAGAPEAGRAERLAELFAGVLETIDAERGQLIGGIGRYARNQTALSERIEAMQRELAALGAAEEKDFDRIEELEDTLTWDTRIFRDRAQALTYVCETPVLLEQRAFAIARLIAARL
jgi:hypothetical protein